MYVEPSIYQDTLAWQQQQGEEQQREQRRLEQQLEEQRLLRLPEDDQLLWKLRDDPQRQQQQQGAATGQQPQASAILVDSNGGSPSSMQWDSNPRATAHMRATGTGAASTLGGAGGGGRSGGSGAPSVTFAAQEGDGSGGGWARRWGLQLQHHHSEKPPGVLRTWEVEPGAPGDYLPEWLSNKLDFVVVFGGDGTVLWTCHIFGNRSVPPLVPFNLGSLGFLTPFEPAALRRVLGKVVRGVCGGDASWGGWGVGGRAGRVCMAGMWG